MRTGDRWVSGVLRHRNTDEYPMIHSRIEKKCNTESSWLLSSGRKWNKLERFHRPWPYRMAASFQWDKSSIWHGQFLVIICIESSASVLLVFLISVLFIWWLFGWKNVERGLVNWPTNEKSKLSTIIIWASPVYDIVTQKTRITSWSVKLGSCDQCSSHRLETDRPMPCYVSRWVSENNSRFCGRMNHRCLMLT